MATKLARVLSASVFLFALGITPLAFASDTDQGTEQVDPCGDEMNPCDDEQQGMMDEEGDAQGDTEEGQIDEEVEVIQVEQ